MLPDAPAATVAQAVHQPLIHRGRFKCIALPGVLLAASLVTTTANGARFMQNYLAGAPPVVRDGDLWPWPWLMQHPALCAQGLAFSGALLAILLIHEFGHYFACRWHRIQATLPWVLPAPTLSGTMGAIIRIRSRIPSRNALMDVGIYGPLTGYIASCIAVLAGFVLSRPLAPDAPGPMVQFGGEPFTIRMLHAVAAHWRPGLPSFTQLAPHPILIAGWIGLFITSLNLVPGGQLDGGHILYAISPRVHQMVTRILPGVLVLGGIVCWAGWLLWGVFLLLPALRHPQVAAQPPLSRRRVVLGAVGLLVLVLSFTPTPFYDNSLLYFFR